MIWDEDRLTAEFKRVCHKLDKIDALLRGNGGAGLVSRVDNLDKAIGGLKKALWILFTVGASFSLAIIYKTIIGI